MRKFILLFCLAVALVGGGAPLTAQADNVLEAVIAEYVAAGDPALVVQVTTFGGTWTAAGGMATEIRRAEVADRFRIGSMSKTFVAVVALKLAEEGILALDQPAAGWLPAEVIERVANADQATIRQLLAMRSGIPDYLATDAFWEAVSDDPAYEWTAREAITYAYDLPALFAPDADFDYSNSNYLLVQLVLEAATGMPLSYLTREYILDPLRLSNTYTQGEEELPGGFVLGWEDWDGDGELDEVSAINDGWGLGDGALISTVGDLTIFYRELLLLRTVLRPASLTALLDFGDTGDDGSYSLGLEEWDSEFGTAWGHSGAVSGFQSIGYFLPDEGAFVMVLSASAETDVYEIAEAAVSAILE